MGISSKKHSQNDIETLCYPDFIIKCSSKTTSEFHFFSTAECDYVS